MPPKTVLGHVHLYVDDIDKAEAFYHTALGFDKVVWSYPGALFMSAGGYHHHLGTTPGPAARRRPATHAGCWSGDRRATKKDAAEAHAT